MGWVTSRFALPHQLVGFLVCCCWKTDNLIIVVFTVQPWVRYTVNIEMKMDFCTLPIVEKTHSVANSMTFFCFFPIFPIWHVLGINSCTHSVIVIYMKTVLFLLFWCWLKLSFSIGHLVNHSFPAVNSCRCVLWQTKQCTVAYINSTMAHKTI